VSEGTPEKIDALTERLSAYVDGEVSAAEALEIETMLSRNATARRIVAELRALSERVGSLPIERAPGDMKERVLAALERDALLDAGADLAPPGPPAGWRVFQLLATAALVAFAVGVGYFIYLTVIEPARLVSDHEIRIAANDEREAKPEAPVPLGEPMGGSRDSDAASRRGADQAVQPPPAASRELRTSEADDARDVSAERARESAAAARPEAVAAADHERESSTMTPEPPDGLTKGGADDESPAGAAGFISPETLVNQRLDDVKNQVTITVADAESERTVIDNVQQFMRSNSLIDAEALPKDVQLAPTQQLYTLNSVRLADATESNQFLVRANPSVINSLLANVQSAVPTAEFQHTGSPELYYFDEAPADQFRKAGEEVTQSMDIVGSAGGNESATARYGQAIDSTVAAAPVSGVTEAANVPVRVPDESEAKSKQAQESAEAEPLRRDNSKKESSGVFEPQQTQPAEPMQHFKPDLEERPVLVLLNIARVAPASQAVTTPTTQSALPRIANE
jgi:hypothetical protein